MDKNVFAEATRRKLRYPSTRGFISTEDLWDCNRDQLDNTFTTMKRLKDSSESVEGLIKRRTAGSSDLDIGLEVVEAVFAEITAAAEVAAERRNRAIRNQRIRELIAEKQDGELATKSKEELTALLRESDAE